MRETVRAWNETLETFVLEVIFDKRRGKRATLMRIFLFGCHGGNHFIEVD